MAPVATTNGLGAVTHHAGADTEPTDTKQAQSVTRSRHLPVRRLIGEEERAILAGPPVDD
jgi:hypothetical protein